MRLLREQLHLALQGEGRCVAVTGEAGIGKSRLVSEFCQLISLDGTNVASLVVQPHDVHRPFAAFADLFPRLLDMPGALGISPDSMSLLQRLVRSPSGDPTAFGDAVKDSDSFSHAITHAIVDLIDAVTGESPLVLAIEDVSSLDVMSLRLFGYLLSGSRRRRLFLLVTSREPVAWSVISADHLATMVLGGVDTASIARFVVAFAERHAVTVDAEMAQWLRDASGGNPLFIENLLAHYTSTHERFSIPSSLSSLLWHRMDALSDRAAAALQTCAILGKFSTIETILGATQLPRFELIQAMRELETARLVRADGQEVRPIHALVSDVILQRMSPLERSLSHQCAALALEVKLCANQSAVLVWECAEHWYASGNNDRALAAIQRCANHAIEVGRPEAAAQMLARALDLSTTPAERAAIAERLVAAADAGMDSDLVLQAIAALDRNRSVVQHDELEFAEIRARSRTYCDGRGQERDLFNCLADATASADHRVRAATLLLKYADSSMDGSVAVRAIELLPDEVLHRASELVGLEYLMIMHIASSQYDDSAKTARQFLRAVHNTSETARHQLSINAILALYESGNADEAVQIATRCYQDATQAENPRVRLALATFLADYYSDVSDDERSSPWRRTMEEIAEAYPTLRSYLMAHISRLGVSIAIGDLQAARRAFDEMEGAKLFEGGFVRTRWRRLARLRINQMQGGPAMNADELAALVSAVKQGANVTIGGVCDAEVAVVCHELLRTAGALDTINFFNFYTKQIRRSRAPLPRCLVEALRAAHTGNAFQSKAARRRARFLAL
jgi:hypothetical protein